jgi:hypothetical protein
MGGCVCWRGGGGGGTSMAQWPCPMTTSVAHTTVAYGSGG